jgi:transcriptional regulator with XRE-family HTH domain
VVYFPEKGTARDREGYVPAPTPGRGGIEPPEGALYPSQILARNLGTLRRLRGYRQEHVANRMMFLGHQWSRQTVGEVEQGRRNVTTDELFSLALVLHSPIDGLFDPHVDGAGLEKVALVRPTSVAASRANSGESPAMLIDATDLHGILCGRETGLFVAWDHLGRLSRVEMYDKREERA